MTDSYSQEDEPKEAFFVDAKNYLIAAGTLLNQRQQLYLDSGPIYMLYFHSAELALKAFLMYRGIKSSELKKKWKHNLEKMYSEALRLGLNPNIKDSIDFQNVICLLHDGNSEEAFDTLH